MRHLAEFDPALAIHVLRQVNSVRFRRGAATDCLDQAGVRMGSVSMRQSVEEAINTSTPLRDPFAKAIRDYSVRVATSTRAVIRVLNLGDAERAFFAAVVRDVGRLLLIQSGLVDYSELPSDLESPVKLGLWERKQLGYDHARLGWHALSVWGIPEPIPTVVAWHHQVGRALFIGGDIGRLVALTRVGELITETIGLHEELSDQEANHMVKEQSFAHLKITGAKLRDCWPNLRAQVGT